MCSQMHDCWLRYVTTHLNGLTCVHCFCCYTGQAEYVLLSHITQRNHSDTKRVIRFICMNVNGSIVGMMFNNVCMQDISFHWLCFCEVMKLNQDVIEPNPHYCDITALRHLDIWTLWHLDTFVQCLQCNTWSQRTLCPKDQKMIRALPWDSVIFVTTVALILDVWNAVSFVCPSSCSFIHFAFAQHVLRL